MTNFWKELDVTFDNYEHYEVSYQDPEGFARR